jgi:hypothetical protein
MRSISFISRQSLLKYDLLGRSQSRTFIKEKNSLEERPLLDFLANIKRPSDCIRRSESNHLINFESLLPRLLFSHLSPTTIARVTTAFTESDPATSTSLQRSFGALLQFTFATLLTESTSNFISHLTFPLNDGKDFWGFSPTGDMEGLLN